jgi:hypothetical protein
LISGIRGRYQAMVGKKQLQAEWVADKSEESGRFGPSGFMELGGNSLVVDSGDIYMSETAVGYLYEDGHIINIAGAIRRERAHNR